MDLDLFKRYSLAIRQETAPAEEVLALLDATRAQVLAAAGGDGTVAGTTGHDRRPVPEPMEDGDAPAESEWAAEVVEAPRRGRRRARRATGTSPGTG